MVFFWLKANQFTFCKIYYDKPLSNELIKEAFKVLCNSHLKSHDSAEKDLLARDIKFGCVKECEYPILIRHKLDKFERLAHKREFEVQKFCDIEPHEEKNSYHFICCKTEEELESELNKWFYGFPFEITYLNEASEVIDNIYSEYVSLHQSQMTDMLKNKEQILYDITDKRRLSREDESQLEIPFKDATENLTNVYMFKALYFRNNGWHEVHYFVTNCTKRMAAEDLFTKFIFRENADIDNFQFVKTKLTVLKEQQVYFHRYRTGRHEKSIVLPGDNRRNKKPLYDTRLLKSFDIRYYDFSTGIGQYKENVAKANREYVSKWGKNCELILDSFLKEHNVK